MARAEFVRIMRDLSREFGDKLQKGAGAPATTTSGQGAAATGYGGGGEGAKSTANDTTNYAGGAGSPGAIRLIHHILR